MTSIRMGVFYQSLPMMAAQERGACEEPDLGALEAPGGIYDLKLLEEAPA